jgi:DNA-binding GntR family transcriptional regulator
MHGLRKKLPVREMAYQYLKELVLSGQIESGERLIQDFIAQNLQISRTPIREALHRLQSEGLIDQSDTGGFRVTNLSLEALEEMFDIRTALEGYLMHTICKNITEIHLDKLSNLIESSQRALEKEAFEEVLKWNTDFHDTLYSCAAQKRKSNSIISNMKEHIMRYRRDTLHHPEAAQRAIDAHRKILFALKLGDPNLCEYIMKLHIHESKKDAIRITFGVEYSIDKDGIQFSKRNS